MRRLAYCKQGPSRREMFKFSISAGDSVSTIGSRCKAGKITVEVLHISKMLYIVETYFLEPDRDISAVFEVQLGNPNYTKELETSEKSSLGSTFAEQ